MLEAFELFAKIRLDKSEYDKGLDDAGNELASLGKKLNSGFATIKKIAVAAGIGAAATAVGKLAKTSLDAYGEYEQLVGGVETLFKTSADVVMGYAKNAYKTAGLSANEYMSTVTSFSASLLQSLGGDTQAAAEKADLAITDMADNANKMGTSMEMIQNAYQGFAKQNYTMLDNLKLGYGGTKEEMARLIEDAAKLKGLVGADAAIYANQGVNGDLSIIVDAIHTVQKELGISGISAKEAAEAVASGAMTQEEAFAAMGTTAKEASTTIQGSLSAAKSAWTNLVTGIADENANLDVLIDNFVNSVSTAGGNIIPRFEKILVGVGETVAKLAPILGEKVPEVIVAVLPSMLDAGTKLFLGLVTGIINAMPDLVAAVPVIIETFVTTVGENLPAILAAGTMLLSMFSSGILNGIPAMIEQLPQVIDNFLNFISEHLPDILKKGVEFQKNFYTGIINAIPDMLSQLPKIIKSFVEFFVKNFPIIVKAGMDILANLIIGIIDNLPQIGSAVGSIVTAIVIGFTSMFGTIIDVGRDIVRGIWDGIIGMGAWITDKVTGFFDGIVDGVKDTLGIHSPSRIFAGIGENMALGIGEGWDSEFGKIKKDVESGLDFGTANVDFASSSVGVSTAGMVNGITAGMNQNTNTAPMIFKLVLPDGTELATYLLNPLAAIASANGTPILNPV